jgi:NodT family efflux transporter outer membrane factor (OMF) lipoprotein
LLFFLAGCRVGGDYDPPELSLPQAYAAAPSTSAPAQDEDLAAWWTRFKDPTLDALVRRALANNLDLQIAAQRIREARAAIGVASGAARPSAELGASAVRREPSTSVAGGEFLPQRDAPFHSLGFDARWELDLFGHVAREVESVQAAHGAAIEAARGTLLSVVAEVARAYLALRGAEAEERLLERELASQLDTAALVAARVEAGLEDELALSRARALVASTETRRPELARRRAAEAHALDVLLGKWPGELARELGAQPGTLPEPPPVVASGLPLELVRRRPDVRQAERELAQASARSAQAVTELYPRLSLGAAFGWESEDASELFDSASRSFSVGPALVAPLLSGGVLRWGIRARDAQEAQARLHLERTLLESLREVEDALVARERTEERVAALATARAADEETLTLARERWSAGLEDFLGVLDAERAALAAEIALVRARAEHATAVVALYKALGGGWEGLEAPALAAAEDR